MIVTVQQVLKFCDLLCENQDGDQVIIDPFVARAVELPEGSDYIEVARDMIGKTYVMTDYWINGSVYYCHNFDEEGSFGESGFDYRVYDMIRA